MSAALSDNDLPAKPANVFGDYRGVGQVFDECLGPAGGVRPHWEKFSSSFNRLGREELALRWENGRRIIREHGVTYNVYGDPQGMDRPWELDMVPLLIGPDEWQRLEAGLVQRAHLLNLILTDLYGPQRLLRDGLIPPALVFANPAFLRSCHGLRTPKNIYLHLLGTDLARSPDGQWWVLGDRCQAPSGAGYALENRIVLSRILPEEFRDCHVQRLAAFYQLGRDTLRALAPGGRDNPNVVLLTPGPHNETYFEHAYMARYLGFTLVEGGDLTVRDRRVFLKTLEGLQPVDVILRRVDDTFCDPVELRSDSFLGVPGLVEAARAGQVTVANALGSGLVESPALLAFLPGLCRHLLGEELKLPSVATWWCGQAKEQQLVIDRLEEMVIKPAFVRSQREPFFGGRLPEAERAALIESMRSRPYAYVGQEQVQLSTAPVWLNQRLEPRRVALRAYVAATVDGFVAMPGGLTRVSSSAENPVVSMQSGGGSKDTWVLSHGPVSAMSLLSSMGQPVSAPRVSTELPSRVADNLYWLGRYAERLEHRLRILRCVLARLSDEGGGEGSPGLSALTRVLAGHELIKKPSLGGMTPKQMEQEVLQLIYQPQREGSVRELLARIRSIASMVRDRFSADTWRILNQLQSDTRSRPGRLPLANSLTMLNTLVVNLGAFSGMEMENMTRGHSWRFLEFGRRLERAANLVTDLRSALGSDLPTSATLEPLLEIADSVMTYRRRYFAQAQLASVLDLLLADVANPRALAFQLRALTEHTANLPRDPRVPAAHSEQRRLADLTRRLRKSDLHGLARRHESGEIGVLTGWLSEFLHGLSDASEDLTRDYFSHTVARVS